MYRVLSQANERRGGKGKEAHEYHQTSGNDEGVGDAYLLGNESRKQQPNGAGQDGQTVIEREDATEFLGGDFDLQDGAASHHLSEVSSGFVPLIVSRACTWLQFLVSGWEQK